MRARFSKCILLLFFKCFDYVCTENTRLAKLSPILIFCILSQVHVLHIPPFFTIILVNVLQIYSKRQNTDILLYILFCRMICKHSYVTSIPTENSTNQKAWIKVIMGQCNRLLKETIAPCNSTWTDMDGAIESPVLNKCLK